MARTTKGQGGNPDLSKQPDLPPIGASLSRFSFCVNREGGHLLPRVQGPTYEFNNESGSPNQRPGDKAG